MTDARLPLRKWTDPRLTGWLECIPNVSEGRDSVHLEAMEAVVRSVPGVYLLHRDTNADAHRTVFTWVGQAEAVAEAAFQLYRWTSEHLAMEEHHGAHPRQGAVDVCPLVPLGETPWSVATETAQKLAHRLATELDLGGWFYEKSATRPERTRLADFRRGGYESLPAKAVDPAWTPDFGSFSRWKKTGMTVVGARPLLVAYNFTLSPSLDLTDAQWIAAHIREPKGGMPGLRALGWYLDGYNRAQVSCNLTQTEDVTAKQVWDAVKRLAVIRGGSVSGSEPIGLLPAHTLRDFSSLQEALDYLKLDHLAPFDPQERILENALNTLPLEAF